MIWVTDAQGQTTYCTPELLQLLGRSEQECAGLNWLDALHPDDVDTARQIMVNAVQGQSAFTLRFRLRLNDRSYIWVMSGAVPSFGPLDHGFLGFLGSLTKVCPSGSEPLKAYGSVGEFRPPKPHPLTTPHSSIDLMADHLLLARAAALESHEHDVIPAIDIALVLVARRLAEAGKRRSEGGVLH